MPASTPDIPPRPRAAADPATLLRLRHLEMRARVVVDGFWQGMHRSPYRGFSNEFAEYRSYTPGDDSRTIDWKVLARTDRVYIRTFEEETSLAAYVLLDVSRSMDYGSLGYTKLDYARTLAATLAVFLEEQGDSTGLITFSDRVGQVVPARRGRRHVRNLCAALEQPSAPGGTSLESVVTHLLRSVRRRGAIIFLSDFLAPMPEIESQLRTLASCGHDVSIFQILDPAEVDFTLEKPGLLRDLETGRQIAVNPATARQHYLDRLHEHDAALRQAASSRGILHHFFRTDRPLEEALFEHLNDRRSRRHLPRRALRR